MNFRLILFCFAVIMAACTSGKQNTQTDQSSESDGWPLMDEFHMVMAESFHPYMDSGNLEPAKKYAEELTSLAERWKQAPLPTRVDNENVRTKLSELAAESKIFYEQTKSGNDKEAGDKLDHLHDLFHELQDAWYHAGK